MPPFLCVRLNKKPTLTVVKQKTPHPNVAETPALFCNHTSASGVCFMVQNTQFSMEEITSGHGGQLWPVGLSGGGDCKVSSLTPQTIWGPRGRQGCGGRTKSTLVPATPRLEWPYARFSATGQLPLNPAVWGTHNMMFISQKVQRVAQMEGTVRMTAARQGLQVWT